MRCRPLVGSLGTPCFPEKKPKFFGHFGIDKRRYQMQREEVEFLISYSPSLLRAHAHTLHLAQYKFMPLYCFISFSFDTCALVCILCTRKMLYLLRIVLSPIHLNLKWHWNGAYYKKNQSFRGRSCTRS